MPFAALDLFRAGGAEALWRRCLGFFELGIDETVALQHRLLERQLRLLAGSPLGHSLLQGREPRSYRELREIVNFTTYEDYADTLGRRRVDVLPQTPRLWTRTSGRNGGLHRWYPVAPGQLEEWQWLSVGAMLAASASDRGDIRLREQARFLNLMAPPPYTSGTLTRALEEAWPLRMYPRSAADAMHHERRTAEALAEATSRGVDFVGSLAAVLPSIAEALGRGIPPATTARSRRLGAVARSMQAAIRARLRARSMLPSDLWRLQGIVTGGLDSTLFRERIRAMWGRYPLDTLVNTEGGFVAMQGWDFTSMTLIPSLNFFEFLPEDQIADADDGLDVPHTVLLSEVEAGRNYELVITNLQGGPVLRYRTGDIVRVTSIGNGNLGTELPQFVHYGRTGGLVEIGGFVRLTEGAIAQAIASADLPHVGWSARKEVEGDNPVLHLRLELEPGVDIAQDEALAKLDAALGVVDTNWADMAAITGLRPLRITYLPAGSFVRYADHAATLLANLRERGEPFQLVNVHDAETERLDEVAREIVEAP